MKMLLLMDCSSTSLCQSSAMFFFNDPAPPELYTLSLHDALPICPRGRPRLRPGSQAHSRRAELRGGQIRGSGRETHPARLRPPVEDYTNKYKGEQVEVALFGEIGRAHV